MNKKLLQAKSEWIKFMCEYYFEEKDENFLPEKNEREDYFLSHIKRGLKLNKKDFIEYLDSEGFMADAYLEILEVKDDER
tara:strand:- start:239 stop:478 length:240 start_codon:yes stop_codon:yes gene_type:complete